ncbi:MAG: DAK2 domain-containing protein [Lawsonibacter sp.]|nr:DAK2 domain-containing protein [Lawsonibacter sp.]
MTLDRTAVGAMLTSAAQILAENGDYLSQIDSRFGDGDHGITIGKIAKLIQARVPEWGSRSIKDFFNELGMAIMEVNGGSAGPLYGTMIGGFGAQLGDDENELDSDGVRRMFSASLAEMEDITTAKVGDKTMMDALIPAVQAAASTQGDGADILEAAAVAAEAGAKASEGFVSKFGRARSYKEQTIGTPDAGAVSTALFFRGLANGVAGLKQPEQGTTLHNIFGRNAL